MMGGKDSRAVAASRKRQRSADEGARWSATDKYLETLVELGTETAVTSRERQQQLLNEKYRWIVEVHRPEGLMESKEVLSANMATVKDDYLSWRLDISVSSKGRDGWVPWLKVKQSDTHTGYRVYALREFRRNEIIGWFYGVPSGNNDSPFCKHGVDAEGSTNYPAGMAMHLMADPSVGLDDEAVARAVRIVDHKEFRQTQSRVSLTVRGNQ
jgi:hypothetical protein